MTAAASLYEDGYAHLADELHKLDRLLRLRILEFRLRTRPPDPASATGMYISDEEVDRLCDSPPPADSGSPELTDLRQDLLELDTRIAARVRASLERGVFLALPQLAHVFALSPFELQALVVCLAPELDRKYDLLYAYLQDDITRRKPSVDLILQLLCDSAADRWRARSVFSPQAPLLRVGLLEVSEDPQSPAGASDLARFLRVDSRILGHLLGDPAIDPRLADLARLYPPLASLDEVAVDPQIKTSLLHLGEKLFLAEQADPKKVVLYLHGAYGAGKRQLARGLCGRLGCQLLCLDADLLLAEPDFEETLRRAFRESLLSQAALYLDSAEPLLREEAGAKAAAKKLGRVISEYGWLTFLAGEESWSPRGLFQETIFFAYELPIPEVALRQAVWSRVLEDLGESPDPGWAKELGSRFRLTPGQIRDAAGDGSHQRIARGEGDPPALADLYAACRRQSNQKLGQLATKIEPRHGRQDLVLPPDKHRQLQEVLSHVRYRYRVFGDWGFDRKLSGGKGLSVLFFGPPGTGKTLAAEVIAGELGLDLYQVDLSGVISKYIGETEKNLSKIFHEAETSNAILFFDEADALFGKRTEVSDSHDRYANIETSYLLQKMEEYEGVVILATNLRENMDEAFTRRIRFIVEFPFPDEAGRLRIWQTHFPREAPLGEGMDYEFLARRFQIAGGNIKNIALNAAFFAAADGGTIGMEQILRGMKREFEKIGKLWDEKNLVESVRMPS